MNNSKPTIVNSSKSSSARTQDSSDVVDNKILQSEGIYQPKYPTSEETSPNSAIKIKILKQPSSFAWVEQAISNLDTILLDHSHCERKAASTAINMMFRYPAHHKLVRQLTAIAAEELEHFELVNQWLDKRNIPLAPLDAPPYGAKLKSQIRTVEPERLLDLLLISAIIEARSHERLGLLAKYCPDRDLAKFYQGLMASEARHYGIYWLLADHYCQREAVNRRLEELATFESEILATLHPKPRVHS